MEMAWKKISGKQFIGIVRLLRGASLKPNLTLDLVTLMAKACCKTTPRQFDGIAKLRNREMLVLKMNLAPVTQKGLAL